MLSILPEEAAERLAVLVMKNLVEAAAAVEAVAELVVVVVDAAAGMSEESAEWNHWSYWPLYLVGPAAIACRWQKRDDLAGLGAWLDS